MVDVKAFLKEVNELATNAKEVIETLIDFHNSTGIPNSCLLNDEHIIFNIRMNEQVNNLRMNFSVYQAGINAYLFDLVSFVPQEDYNFPQDCLPGSELFTITGTPALGAHNLQRAINAMSLEEAVEASLEYVFDNLKDIIKEVMGGESIQDNPGA